MDKNADLAQKILEEVVRKYFVFRITTTAISEDGSVEHSYTEKAWDILQDINKMIDETYPKLEDEKL